MSSTVSNLGGTTTSSTTSATSTDIMSDFQKDQKPLQSYLYPTLSLIIVILVSVHACRLLERRRMRIRYGRGSADGDGDEGIEARAGPAAKLVRPRMYDIYLDGRRGEKDAGRDLRWDEIMPLSSNMLVQIEDNATATTAHTPESREPWLAEDSRMNLSIIVDRIKHVARLGLEMVSLYNRRAAREARERARARARSRRANVDPTDQPEVLLDPSLPRELVTGVMILMPTPPRAVGNTWEEEQLPVVAVGIRDQDWVGRIDVKDGTGVASKVVA